MSRREAREEAAHRYAEAAGWPVFPVEPGGKRPIPQHGLLEATTDHGQIERWFRDVPNANLGIATGVPGPDVLDVDVHKGGTGYGPLRELKQAGLVPEPLAFVRTPSGGAHLYYQGTEQRNGHLSGQHLDYRGQGGYVVAPPSRIAGRDYEVLRHQASDATFDWAAAKQLLAPEPERQPYRAPERGDGQPQSLDHLVRYVGECSDHVNDRLFWAACRMAEAGQQDRLPELIRAAYAAGEDRRGQAERTVESALRTIGGASAQHTAAQGAGRLLEHSGGSGASPAVQLHPQAEAEAGALPAWPASGPATALQRPAGP